jgi:hypothetical protein
MRLTTGSLRHQEFVLGAVMSGTLWGVVFEAGSLLGVSITEEEAFWIFCVGTIRFSCRFPNP